MKSLDEPLCLNRDVNVVEEIDVRQMSGSDEPLSFDSDVRVVKQVVV